MRIAFFSPEYVSRDSFDGGLANYIKKTAEALVDRGCSVWVFVRSNHDSIWDDGDIKVCEVQVEARLFSFLKNVPIFNRFRGLIFQLQAASKLANRFWEMHAKFPFDIIQVSSYMAPGWLIKNNGKVPVVCRVSSYSPFCRAAFGREKRSIAEYLSDRIEANQVSSADSSFAPSNFMANTFNQFENCSVIVLRTPVDYSEVELDGEYFAYNKPNGRYLLFFGTLSQIKGIDLIAFALPIVLARYKDIRMVFIGRDDGMPDGTKAFEYILSHCQEFKESIFYYPAQPKSKLYSFISNAEAVLMPSRVDNYPNACLESQLFGIPVIGTNHSSLEEMIDNKITGMLSDNNPDAFAKTICRFLDMGKDERKKMKKHILSSVQAIKDEDRIGQLVRFYKKTIAAFPVKAKPNKIPRHP